MTRIHSLRPNATREEAVRQFSAGVSGYIRKLSSGPLRAVADFYIPFRIFEMEIANRGSKECRILGVDAVTGSLDPYYFDHSPDADQIVEVQTRNRLEPTLNPGQAEKIAVTKVQRLLFTKGFFRLRSLNISVRPVSSEIHVPYWAGFRGRSSSASLEVIDAVRRQPEGARVRRMLEGWLTANSSFNPSVPLPANS
jgi:hypothetical protein